MANDICQRQNQAEVLKCLVVQRRLYSFVKCWQIIPVCATALSAAVPLAFEKSSDGCGLGDWVSAALAVIVWASTLLVGMFRDSAKRVAVSFQQYVDYRLFSGAMRQCGEWPGMPLPSEIAQRISKVAQRDIECEKVKDWYSDYSLFNEQYAVLCCQKENVRWDRALRVLMLVILVCALVGWIMWGAVRLYDVTLRCALPLLGWYCGGVVAVCRLCILLYKDVLRIRRMEEAFKQAEAHIVQGVDSAGELMKLQEFIHEHRKCSFLVPDIVYKLSRGKFQAKEDANARCHQEMLS